MSLWALWSCSTSEKNVDGVKLSGKVRQPIAGEVIKIEKLGTTELEVVSTIELDGEGEFVIGVTVDQPSFYRINFYDRQYLNLILTGEEAEVKLEVDGDRPQGFSQVSGSTDTQLLTEIDELANKTQSDIQMLNTEAVEARARGDVNALQDITQQYYYIQQKNLNALKKKLIDSAPSLAALYGLNSIDINNEFAFVDSLATKFENSIPHNPHVISLMQRVEALRKLAIGSPAPEIALPNPNGEVLSLSSLKGNYVLVDFWAAWCRPCRMENPNVVRMYNEYKDRNFEILGVSLDKTKEAWLKAIADDGLTWKHISDLRYFQSEAAREYQINAIPATYLIGPDGNIVAKNLRGASLEAKLKEIFG